MTDQLDRDLDENPKTVDRVLNAAIVDADYDHRQSGGPLTCDDLDFNMGEPPVVL